METTVFFFSLFMVVFLTPKSDAQTRNNGFSVEIMSMDSPSSPFYNPSDTDSSRIKKAAQRSFSRLHYLQSSLITASPNDVQPPVMPSAVGGLYIMNVSLGSTGSEISVLVDTGSEFTWTQCIPCDNCYTQSTPRFDPAKSSSYTNLDCTSSFCKALPRSSCNDGSCHYTATYGDGTTLNGILATDTMTLVSGDGSTVSFPVAFGCSHDVKSNTLPNTKVGGAVGVGVGPLSLISQMGSFAIGRFSYCLTDRDDKTSKGVLNFGNRAVFSGDGLVTTPMITGSSTRPYYYVTLDDISVGSQKLNIPPGTFHLSSKGEGGLIVDSGTTLTFLNKIGYDLLLTALKGVINFPVAAQPVSPFQLCYHASSRDIINSFPDVTFHFLGGDVIVGGWNIFVEVDGFACLAVAPVSNGVSIYGNVVQQDFHVGFDLVHQTISFAHADCTKI